MAEYNYTAVLTQYTDWIQSLIEYTMGKHWQDNLKQNIDVFGGGDSDQTKASSSSAAAGNSNNKGKDLYLEGFQCFCSVISLLLNIFIAGAFVCFRRVHFFRIRNLIVVAIIAISSCLLVAVVCKAVVFWWPGGDRSGSSSVHVPILGIPGVALFLNILLAIVVFDRI